MYQKEQLHDNTVSMMQSQHFSVSFIVQKNNISFLYTFYVMFIIILMDQNPFSILFAFNLQQMGRTAGFSLGGLYPSHRTQQQQQHAPSVSSNGVSFSSVNNQDLLHLHGTDIFPSSHSTYHSQVSKFSTSENGALPFVWECIMHLFIYNLHWNSEILYSHQSKFLTVLWLLVFGLDQWASWHWTKASDFSKYGFWYGFIWPAYPAVSTAPEPVPVPPSADVSCKSVF